MTSQTVVSERARVTVVNDNPDFLELVGEILADERYPTTLVDGDKPDALQRIRASAPEVLMIDLRMGSEALHGWDVLMDVRRDPALARLPTLICTADLIGLESIVDRVDAMPGVSTLTKPFTVDALTRAIADLAASSAAR